jgi:hypothetical protein
VSSTPLSELTGSVGDVISTGTTVLGGLAGSAAGLVADVPARVAELTRTAPPPRRKSPWVLAILVAAAAAGVVWWLRRDRSPAVEGEAMYRVGVPAEDDNPPIAGA